MEKNVARRRYGGMYAVDLAKSVQLLRPRSAEQPVPGFRSKAGYAGKLPVQTSKSDTAHQGGQIGAKTANSRFRVIALIDFEDDEDSRTGQLCDD